jgi:hypothetical protein
MVALWARFWRSFSQSGAANGAIFQVGPESGSNSSGDAEGAAFLAQPQKRQKAALSGLSSPHFGQR